MSKLILLRHGQSVWNLENRFTGWTDVELSPKGIVEAENAGKALLKSGIDFDIAYVSVLKRAIHTLHLAAMNCGMSHVPEIRSWRLNERHYGALQGLNKADTVKKFGAEQVRLWRRSYDLRPPLLAEGDPRSPMQDKLYEHMDRRLLPLGESLKDAIARVMPLWEDAIAPKLLKGLNVFVVAHGNSLRGLVKYIRQISDSDIAQLEIPTGQVLVYEFDGNLELKQYGDI